MQLPKHVEHCLQALERASFPAYAVGGWVRDRLLGRTPQDVDLCTAAAPDQIQAVFQAYPLVLSGVKHGTVGVVLPEGVVEITTFRREGDYSDSRHPDRVWFVEDLHQDLSRRDFTVNAMAFSPTRGLHDPFGGRQDLDHRILRTVGDPEKRFREDPLRILRGVRFAVKYGLTPEEGTFQAMMALAPLMERLARERVFQELCQILPLVTAGDMARFAPVLTQPIPELGATVGFDQRSPHHAYDLYTHISHVVAATPPKLTLRWAALLHDVGKVPTFTQDSTGRGHFYGHAQASAAMAEKILRRLKAPNQLAEPVITLICQHMTPLAPDRTLLRRRLSQLGAPMVEDLLCLQQADMLSKGTGDPAEGAVFPQIRALLDRLAAEDGCLSRKDLAVDGHDLLALGFPAGKALGTCLERLLAQVVDEELPNEKAALLSAAEKMLKEMT